MKLQWAQAILDWIVQHPAICIVATLLVIQWIAFQALLFHYHSFRKNLKRPRPDGLRLAVLEKTITFQNEQIDRLFAKLSELSREMTQAERRREATQPLAVVSPSLESNFPSMGELALRKRIQELREKASIS